MPVKRKLRQNKKKGFIWNFSGDSESSIKEHMYREYSREKILECNLSFSCAKDRKAFYKILEDCSYFITRGYKDLYIVDELD